MEKLPFKLEAYSMLRNVPMNDLVRNLNNLYKEMKFEIKQFTGIGELLKEFSKNAKGTSNYLVLAKLNDEWCILFDDLVWGDGGASNLYNFNRLFGYEGFNVHYSESGTVFNYYKENKKRVIYSIFDGKWVFYQKGEAMDFEDVSYYSKRKIADRFNSSIFIEYLKRLGLCNIEDLLVQSKEIFLAKTIFIK